MSPKKHFKWSSHNPVIMTALDMLKPQFVLELGVGNFSTPLLLQSTAAKLWHIENDLSWLDHVRQTFNIDARSGFRYHEISDRVNKSTLWESLPGATQAALHDYYEALADEVSQQAESPRLLFVDHFTCARTVSINHLALQFDWVIYHDAETPEVYGYQNIQHELHDVFDQYELRTPSSWTGMLVRKGLADHDRLVGVMMDHSEIFGQRFGRSKNEFQFVKT